ncbi:helix-turn-helix transcriptional regulator [Haloarcula amylovorans]|uniref:helix-turn-helix transcriptional regulator n=1 Tax=Haloarcula amylovorans TaxID=2562280 RepID=UPI0010769F19|nr:transcriptional regulator FilR1 domain-containing protein [Halomicroarcula amylolytica]
MTDGSLVEYVGASAVRSAVVGSLCEHPQPTETLLSGLDASDSAVYEALSSLETRGVVEETVDGWRLTGTGRLVGDVLERRQATDELLAVDPEYWANHDASVVPQRFRCRLPELGAYEVLRAAEHDRHRIVREIVSRIDGVDRCDVVSPIYHADYKAAMPDTDDSRLVVGEQVVDDVLTDESGASFTATFERTPVRVSSVPYALAVSAEWVILTLPEPDGRWSDTTILSESDSAVQWGSELFEYVWTAATPVDTYLSA